jgi:hypothetical protein
LPVWSISALRSVSSFVLASDPLILPLSLILRSLVSIVLSAQLPALPAELPLRQRARRPRLLL